MKRWLGLAGAAVLGVLACGAASAAPEGEPTRIVALETYAAPLERPGVVLTFEAGEQCLLDPQGLQGQTLQRFALEAFTRQHVVRAWCSDRRALFADDSFWVLERLALVRS